VKQELNRESIEAWRKKARDLFPSFSSIIDSVNIGFDRSDTKTAEASCSQINLNKTFMAGLKEDEQLFIIMHEVCHIAFGHPADSADKDQELWNTACDAVINIWLLRRGLALPRMAIFMPEAANYESVEAFYKQLVERKRKGDEPWILMPGDKKEEEWPPFGCTGTIIDDHSGWEEEVKAIQEGKVGKPKKRFLSAADAFRAKTETHLHSSK